MAIEKKRSTPSKSKISKKPSSSPRWKFSRNVVPDSIDLRDRPYIPSVMVIPAEVLSPKLNIPILNQGDTNACTGFGLASVIYHLQSRAKRKPAQYAVSPFMPVSYTH